MKAASSLGQKSCLLEPSGLQCLRSGREKAAVANSILTSRTFEWRAGCICDELTEMKYMYLATRSATSTAFKFRTTHLDLATSVTNLGNQSEIPVADSKSPRKPSLACFSALSCLIKLGGLNTETAYVNQSAGHCWPLSLTSHSQPRSESVGAVCLHETQFNFPHCGFASRINKPEKEVFLEGDCG